MTARLLAALLGALAVYVSSPSFAQNQGGNGGGNQGGGGGNQGGNGGGNQGGNGGNYGTAIAAPEFDGQMIALGLALASGAAVAVKGRFRRSRK